MSLSLCGHNRLTQEQLVNEISAANFIDWPVFVAYAIEALTQQKNLSKFAASKIVATRSFWNQRILFFGRKERKCNEQRFFRHRSQIYFSEGLFLSLLIKTEEKKQIKMLRAFCQTRAPVVGMGRA